LLHASLFQNNEVGIDLVQRIVCKEYEFNEHKYRVDNIVENGVYFNEVESEEEKPLFQLQV
jgi:hypothetical protein